LRERERERESESCPLSPLGIGFALSFAGMHCVRGGREREWRGE